jgi:transposase
MTFNRGLWLTGMTALFIYDGAMNGNVFLTFVEQVQLPTFSYSTLVVVDNLLARSASGMRDAIEAAGASRLCLPPYNPEFNPIESAFAKRALLRAKAVRTIKALGRALVDLINPAECVN